MIQSKLRFSNQEPRIEANVSFTVYCRKLLLLFSFLLFKFYYNDFFFNILAKIKKKDFQNHFKSSSSSFEGHPLQVGHQQDWGRGFILLLPQTAALPGSDAGRDVIKPASSFVIQNRQTSCSMWCLMYRARC